VDRFEETDNKNFLTANEVVQTGNTPLLTVDRLVDTDNKTSLTASEVVQTSNTNL
jgi:hypothetical protein